jgi:hypothetical protein
MCSRAVPTRLSHTEVTEVPSAQVPTRTSKTGSVSVSAFPPWSEMELSCYWRIFRLRRVEFLSVDIY